MGKPGFIIPYRGFFVNRFHVFIYKIFLIKDTLNSNYKCFFLCSGQGNVEQAALLCMRVSMNKKKYIKLEARIVALPMKENIAASGVPVPPDIPDHGDVFVGDDDVFEND